MTEWHLSTHVWFDWVAPDTHTREDWVAQDGGYFVNPPAGTDLEPRYLSPAVLEAGRMSGLGLLSALVGLVPGLGDAKDAVQFFTGEDLITGEKLSWFERAIGLLGPLGTGLYGARQGGGAVVATLDGVYDDYRAYALAGDDRAAWALLESTVLERLGPPAHVMRSVDGSLDLQEAAGHAFSIGEAEALVGAADALRGGADPDALEWTAETNALLHVGVLQADRMTRAIDEHHALPPGTADEVRGLLARAFVRQAQADGLLPDRLEVVPTAAEGGDPMETIDVWDPKTGTAWDLDGGGADRRMGGTMTTRTGEVVTITRVETVPLPAP
jgi:hypothetical protein